ncbi:hypothetical protein [Streptomyces yangpuensis]|uniref:hypothetical protein n=1 Tax=Streptomyces yangpuensis TaxID=1648182 RepID=UPI003668FC0F
MTGQPQTARDHALQQLLSAAVLRTEQDWHQLTAEQQRVLRAFAIARRRRIRGRAVPPSVRDALAAFATATARFSSNLGALVERWTAVDLPAAYRLGAEDLLDHAVLGPAAVRPLFLWHSTHQSAVTLLTNACYRALISRVNDTVRRAHAFTRAVSAAARSTTPPTAAQLAADHPLDKVTYSGSSRHPAAAWARAALAAQSVTAANTGAVTAATTDLDALWVQVIDGPECGWTSHPELDRAHNTLRSVEEAATFPIAHPGCLRRFIARPDLNNTPIEEGQPA